MSSRKGPRDSRAGASQEKRFPAVAWVEVLGLVVLVGLVVFRLVVSWRRWNHPLIDFGRELYIPWRLSEGAVLYRDVDDVYGPLSQYLNAGLFRIFGPGLMVLVTANLVVFAAILTLSYLLFRRAWGFAGAFSACVVFVAVFAFSQFLIVANFNYVTPYAHEATHGVLACLGLVAVMGRWIEQPTRWRSFAGGLLMGLTFVLKPEFMLASVAATVAAILLRLCNGATTPRLQLALLAAGAIVPTALFAVYFARFFSPLDALQAAGRAWTSLILNPAIAQKNYQLVFVGLDHPWSNLLVLLRKTGLALVVLAAIGGAVFRALKRADAIRFLFLALAVALALVTGLNLQWDHVGQCFFGLNLLYLGFAGARAWRGGRVMRSVMNSSMSGRILLSVLATALMARMFLNGRILQFGFFQAALAGMVIVAVMLGEAAEWMPAVPWRRSTVALAAATLLMPGIVWAVALSQRIQRAQTLPVGEGRDQFFYFPGRIDGSGVVVNAVLEAAKQLPRGSTLFALPEGPMINYLARLPSPLPQFQYYSFTTEEGRELEVVKALDAHPPDYVVIISRDLRDFGITRYGQRDGGGRQIVEWLAQHYRVTHHLGDDPLASEQRGAYILQRVQLDKAN